MNGSTYATLADASVCPFSLSKSETLHASSCWPCYADLLVRARYAFSHMHRSTKKRALWPWPWVGCQRSTTSSTDTMQVSIARYSTPQSTQQCIVFFLLPAQNTRHDRSIHHQVARSEILKHNRESSIILNYGPLQLEVAAQRSRWALTPTHIRIILLLLQSMI